MVHDRDKGFEYLDDTPVAVPVKFRQAPGEVDRMKSLMAQLIVDLRGRSDVESFEESLDFEDPDDDDPLSSRVSHSELRFMKEEKLLQDATEADTIMSQRRAADELRRKIHGDRQSGGKGVSDVASRTGDAVDERGKVRESKGQSGEAASGGSGASEGGGAAA